MIDIFNSDCLLHMKKMEENIVDFIVTDPPYGIKFMSEKWDFGIPGVEFWEEMLRICKPGSMLAAFGGTRTYHRLTCAIEDAGWEIRDCVMWLYGSGFPKSHNKFGLKGYGTALKPAWEPIIIAMKPLEGTYAQNAQKWGVAGINIDESRIGLQGATKRSNQVAYPKNEDGTEDRSHHWARTGHNVEELNKGRWPSNVILDEEAGQFLDQQTGILKSGSMQYQYQRSSNAVYGARKKANINYFAENSGGASRFFYCAKASSSERNAGLEGMPLKESGAYGEFKGDGRGRQTEHQPRANNHPTVKPLSLMRYIIKLLAPPDDPLLLDPFMGSGSTLCAAAQLRIRAIGIDKEEEYCKIAKERVIHHQKEK